MLAETSQLSHPLLSMPGPRIEVDQVTLWWHLSTLFSLWAALRTCTKSAQPARGMVPLIGLIGVSRALRSEQLLQHLVQLHADVNGQGLDAVMFLLHEFAGVGFLVVLAGVPE